MQAKKVKIPKAPKGHKAPNGPKGHKPPKSPREKGGMNKQKGY